MASYPIRSLIYKNEIEPIEGLQEEIWGYGSSPGSPSPYPARCLFEFAESGGVVAGAYSTDSDSEMIGFSASWLGREPKDEQRPYLHSQLVGVKEKFRDCGVGLLLKLHQRVFAIGAGLPLIKWTFDPLQSRNAYFNLRKLGGIVRRFIPDYYGNLGGKMNHDFPTDRFWVEWHVNSARVANRLEQQHSVFSPRNFPVVNTVADDNGWRQIVSIDLTHSDSHLLIEIPPNISEMRLKAPELASKWQRDTCQIFESYLQTYIIIDCVREEERSFYVLSRESIPTILAD
jgi:predicted GNAT superfamily acetyltransferase